MGFVKMLKMAFGFSDSSEDEELEGIDARVTPLRSRRENDAGSEHANVGDNGFTASCEINDTVKKGAGATSAVAAASEQTHVPDAIFDTVVKIFNESLPEFLQSSVDEKSQREYIYEALDTSMKSYLDKVAENAGKAYGRRFENERRSMQEEMDELRKRVKKEETDSSESKKLQLSAQRQKRALNERISELEKQITALQAENEQYLLENKSLLNKIRLYSVTGGGAVDDETAIRYAELTDSLDATRSELARQKERAAAAEQEAKENLMALDNSRRRLAEETEAYRRKEEALEKNADLMKSQAAVLEAELTSLRSDVTQLTAENGSLREKLDEANRNLEVVEKMNAQLDELEEARRQHDSQRRQLKDELMAAKEDIQRLEKEKGEYETVLEAKENTIRSLEDSTESLRKTIENNLYEHARSESVLRLEIDRLKSLSGIHESQAEQDTVYTMHYEEPVLTAEEPPMGEDDVLEVILPGASSGSVADTAVSETAAPAPAEPKRKSKRGRKPKPRISAIDDTIADTDWLVATPPIKKKNPQTETNNEFGYKEPDRKITPDHPAQMSLW